MRSVIARMYTVTLYFLLLFLPWQTIFIIRQVMVKENVWHYATVGVYATELLLIIVFIFFLCKKESRDFVFSLFQKKNLRAAVIICGTYLFFSTLSAPAPHLGFFSILRFFEAGVLILILMFEKKSRDCSVWIVLGCVPVTLLGIAQYVFNTTFPSSFLGLSLHDPEMLGTPVVLVEGVRHLRAFGSFLHPNIFGGYMMALSLIALARYFKTYLPLSKMGWFLATMLFMAGLVVSFSRSALIAWLIGVTILWSRERIKKSGTRHLTHYAIIVGIVLIMLVPFTTMRLNQSPLELRSLIERNTQLERAFALWRTAPFFGVGFQNYTVVLHRNNPELPGYALQPVHNVLLLILTELGIVGVGLIFVVSYYAVQRIASEKKHAWKFFMLTLSPLLIFDHYLWTIYSGNLLLAVMIVCIIDVCNKIKPLQNANEAVH